MDKRISGQAVIDQNEQLLFSSLDSLFPLPIITENMKAQPCFFISIDVIQKLFLVASELYPFHFPNQPLFQINNSDKQ